MNFFLQIKYVQVISMAHQKHSLTHPVTHSSYLHRILSTGKPNTFNKVKEFCL